MSNLPGNCFSSPMLAIFFILVLSCYAYSGHASCNQLDRDSLLTFSRSTVASPPLNWSVSIDCCFWEGVGCDSNGRVNQLWLPSRGLSGAISTSITNLSHLAQLSLSHNMLHGPLPDRLFLTLHHLEAIDLSFNRLSGPIDSSDKLPATIETVDLSSNHFNETIQSSFFQPALDLVSFNVSNNSFSGPLPSEICSFSPSLGLLDISLNDFNSSIPRGLGRCSKLKVLRAGFNLFTGSLPGDIYSASALEELSLPGNLISGPMSEGILNLTRLKILALYDNELTGGIPDGIGRLSYLEHLLLHINKLDGTLPSSLINCTRITTLNLRVNLLAGELSGFDFSNFFQLRTIDLRNNFFSGTFPATLASCTSLTSICLSTNLLTGEVPPEIQALPFLSFLALSNNTLTNITGAINILGGCKNLKTLTLSKNFYYESLPYDGSVVSSGDQFQNLRILGIGGCQLSGQVPFWLAKLWKLEALDLSFNQLTGPIPKWLGTLPILFYLDLSGNLLSGGLPVELTRLPRLATEQRADEEDNAYLEFPVFVSNDFTFLEYNHLSHLPPGIYLDNNQLIGNIPFEIGDLKFLHILDLSNNKFSGDIPDSISKMKNLEKLDLSENNLSGKSPPSLKQLHFLSSFSVANNNLLGPIPTGGQFYTFPNECYEGNPGLCGEILDRPCISHDVSTTSQFSTERKSRENEMAVFWLMFWISFGISFSFSFVTSCILFRPQRLLGSQSRYRYVFLQH